MPIFANVVRVATRLAAPVAAAALLAGTAHAGEQYLHGGLAIGGYDAVAYHTDNAALPGDDSISFEYNGATWHFTSEENRDLFVADPERYAPAYDGHCAYGAALDGKVPGDPELWAIVDDVLYLNINAQVQGFWDEDRAGHIQQADQNWEHLEAQPRAEDQG